MPVPFVCGAPFVVGKEVIRSHFEAGATEQVGDHEACHQFQNLTSELSSRTEQLQAMSRQELKVVVGLLPGHTTLRAHMFKFRLCGANEDSVRHCPTLARNRYRTLGRMF